jgi:two-component system, cell cycle sensor histidine kinase and response regulator CckA
VEKVNPAMNPYSSIERPGLAGFRSSSPYDPADHGPSRRDRPPTAPRQQILLVEDDHAIRDALQGILEDEGYAVVTAGNGHQALERLRSQAAPDLIVLDLRMPVMDGWQFRAAQKGDPALAGIPVLAISADGSAKAAAIDAHAYLRKPLSTDALLGAISRIFAEAERQRLLRKLEEAERFAALGRLAASVGHEINNPLAFVSMNVDLALVQVNRFLEQGAAVAASIDDIASLPAMFSECRVGLDRIRDVVKDLQRLSRKSHVTRQAFSLNEVLDESVAIARNHVVHRAVLDKQYGALPPVIGDRSAIGQVLLNLIINAAQALPEGRADVNRVSLTTYPQDGDVVVEVADTGSGIEPQLLPHIFDPFFTTKPIGEGTGLGLAVSCRIVADHGGRIEVDSEPGRGSVFRVVLPTASPQLQTRAAEPAVEHVVDQRAARGRVLVIDDVAAIGATIVAALSAHDVTVVARPSEAFALLAANQSFDVILCDLLMPELGGRGVFERLKADWPQLAANVVFMTGGAFTPESREFLSRLPHRVLMKPFSIAELEAAVMAHMQHHVRGRN